jgi:hypothetical protein
MLTTSSHGLTEIFANFRAKSVIICENPCPLKRKMDFSDKLLGYSTISPDRKLQEIRTHGGHPNDWPHEYTDADLLALINREIAFSQ